MTVLRKILRYVRIQWLFGESTALFPSVYLRSEDMTEHTNAQYVISRVNEAIRMSKVSTRKIPVYVYMWSKYQDANRFLNQGDLTNSIVIPQRQGANGVVVWGATKDVNSRDKCLAMVDYLQSYLGPMAAKVIQSHSSPQNTNVFHLFGR